MTSVIIILYVSDQQRSKNFYSLVLNAKPVLDVPGMTEFELTEGARLGLMPSENISTILSPALPHPSKANGIPRCEIYLYCDSPAEMLQRALDAGALPVSPLLARDWGDDAAYVSDPDGHVVAFAKKKGE